jgi:hypothetical protein
MSLITHSQDEKREKNGTNFIVQNGKRIAAAAAARAPSSRAEDNGDRASQYKSLLLTQVINFPL